MWNVSNTYHLLLILKKTLEYFKSYLCIVYSCPQLFSVYVFWFIFNTTLLSVCFAVSEGNYSVFCDDIIGLTKSCL